MTIANFILNSRKFRNKKDINIHKKYPKFWIIISPTFCRDKIIKEQLP